jgi:hypothetical protein
MMRLGGSAKLTTWHKDRQPEASYRWRTHSDGLTVVFFGMLLTVQTWGLVRFLRSVYPDGV